MREAVVLGHFAEEESFGEQEESTLRQLIEEAIPLMDRSMLEFARAVYDAFLSFDDHTSFRDVEIAKYDRLKEEEKYAPSHLRTMALEGLLHSCILSYCALFTLSPICHFFTTVSTRSALTQRGKL